MTLFGGQVFRHMTDTSDVPLARTYDKWERLQREIAEEDRAEAASSERERAEQRRQTALLAGESERADGGGGAADGPVYAVTDPRTGLRPRRRSGADRPVADDERRWVSEVFAPAELARAPAGPRVRAPATLGSPVLGLARRCGRDLVERVRARRRPGRARRDPAARAQAVRTPASPPRDGAALEIGCGAGDDAAHLAHEGFDVLALDVAPRAVAAARAAGAAHRGAAGRGRPTACARPPTSCVRASSTTPSASRRRRRPARRPARPAPRLRRRDRDRRLRAPAGRPRGCLGAACGDADHAPADGRVSSRAADSACRRPRAPPRARLRGSRGVPGPRRRRAARRHRRAVLPQGDGAHAAARARLRAAPRRRRTRTRHTRRSAPLAAEELQILLRGAGLEIKKFAPSVVSARARTRPRGSPCACRGPRAPRHPCGGARVRGVM